MLKQSLIATTIAATFASQAYALNIVMTNDDSYETRNIQQLKLALEAAGHQVLLSTPCAHQSGKGGSLGSYLRPVPVHTLKADADGTLHIDNAVAEVAGYCVGDTEADKKTKTFADFVDATPTQAALHGIAKAEDIWGAKPDLLLSGPNEGQNLGFAVFLSGTLGATHSAILNNIPAVAVSAGSKPKDDAEAIAYAKLVAAKTVAIVEQLEAHANGGPLLGEKTGFNVNLPNAGDLTEVTEYKFTKVNWQFNATVKFGNLGEKGGYGTYYGFKEEQGLVGLNFLPGQDPSGDNDPESEGNALKAGYITMSVIDATENAPAQKEADARARVMALVK